MADRRHVTAVQVGAGMTGLFVAAALTGLTTWAFKLEDRIFQLSRDVPTRTEMTQGFDRMERRLSDILVALQTQNANRSAITDIGAESIGDSKPKARQLK